MLRPLYVLKRNKLDNFNTNNLHGPYNKIVCTKKCWLKANKSIVRDPNGNLSWLHDSVDDMDD